MKVYLDNGATSFPKPKAVEEAVVRALTQFAGSLHRSQSGDALNLEREVYNTRLLLADFFGFNALDHVVFTKNITESINLVLNGFLREGDHVVITGLEHNAVLRPLEFLRKNCGITYGVVKWQKNHGIDLDMLDKELSRKPRLMVATAASNVTGDLLEIEAIGGLCNKYDVPFLVDTAQAAGVIPMDFYKLNATFLAFTGHKSLLGPTGIGGVLIHPKYSDRVTPFILGGTGSLSDLLDQPDTMPDKFESGTQNIVGILGLKAALEDIQKVGLSAIREHEIKLTTELQNGLTAIRGVRLVGSHNPAKRTGIVTITTEGMDEALVVHELNTVYGIATRSGLHCAPLAHRTYGTYPRGAIRFSVSRYNTLDEIDYTVQSVYRILNDH